MNQSEPRKLFRSSTDRIIAGVCGGLAEYLSVDSTVIRLIFVILAIFGGSGLILYIVLALVVPAAGSMPEIDHKEKIREFAEKAGETIKDAAGDFKKTMEERKEVAVRRRSDFGPLIGLFLILFGFLYLLRSLFPAQFWFTGSLFWPLVFILFGLLIINKTSNRG